jgi:hypothetical protein
MAGPKKSRSLHTAESATPPSSKVKILSYLVKPGCELMRGGTTWIVTLSRR